MWVKLAWLKVRKTTRLILMQSDIELSSSSKNNVTEGETFLVDHLLSTAVHHLVARQLISYGLLKS